MSKNVLAGLYGGDVTRKMKMQHKQKVGKARLKERSIGNVVIPTSAFFTVSSLSISIMMGNSRLLALQISRYSEVRQVNVKILSKLAGSGKNSTSNLFSENRFVFLFYLIGS